MNPGINIGVILLTTAIIVVSCKKEHETSFLPIDNSGSAQEIFGSHLIPRSFVAGGSVSSKVMFAGGQNIESYTGNRVFSSRVDVYDTITRAWSTMELSEARAGMASITIGNKILFAGGARKFDYDYWEWDSLSTRVDIYDAASNSWSTTELPEPQLFQWGLGAATVVGDKAYFYSYYKGSNNILVFDGLTNTWSKTPMNGPPRVDLVAVGKGKNVLFAGGLDVSFYYSSPSRYLDRVDILNVDNDTWSTKTLSEPRLFIKATTVSNKVYFAGGQLNPGNTKSIVDIYDDLSQNWTFTSLSKPTFLAGTFAIDQKALFFGDNRIEIYNTNTDTWSVKEIDFSFDADGAIVPLGNSIYILGVYTNDMLSHEVRKIDF